MKLQMALDLLETKKAIELIEKTQHHIDIIEIGTPLIKHEGVSILKKIRSAFPDKEILVDLKTMDVGEYEADFCFKLGADIVTVLGVADIETVKGSLKSARKHGKKVMVDLMNCPDKKRKISELNELKVHLIGIHSGIDQQNYGKQPLDELKEIQHYTDIPLCIAGGIKKSTIAAIVKEKPYTIIIGSEITSSSSPGKIAKALKEMML